MGSSTGAARSRPRYSKLESACGESPVAVAEPLSAPREPLELFAATDVHELPLVSASRRRTNAGEIERSNP